MERRQFLNQWIALFSGLFYPFQSKDSKEGLIMTVRGAIPSYKLGKTLPHEHVLVDFIGAEKTSYDRWDRGEVMKRCLPFLMKLKSAGFSALTECTPAYIGRDPKLLLELSKRSGLHILTNTGYYGARDYLFIPEHAFDETARQLARRWIIEFENGIEDTGIKPGFIKIGVNGKSLLPLEKKLIRAAAITHKKTGLTIASHTGPALAALQQVDELVLEKVHPSAFIWVHAQAEANLSKHIEAASKGAWVSLDGFADKQKTGYVKMLKNLKEHHLLHRVLISHDAGWYSPGESNGGDYRGYTDIVVHLIPALLESGFTEAEIDLLCVKNPANALAIGIKKI